MNQTQPIKDLKEQLWPKHRLRTRTSSHYDYQQKASKLFTTQQTTALSSNTNNRPTESASSYPRGAFGKAVLNQDKSRPLTRADEDRRQILQEMRDRMKSQPTSFYLDQTEKLNQIQNPYVTLGESVPVKPMVNRRAAAKSSSNLQKPTRVD